MLQTADNSVKSLVAYKQCPQLLCLGMYACGNQESSCILCGDMLLENFRKMTCYNYHVTCRKLLCKNKSSQQQHEALVMSCASASNSSGYTPAKRAASILNAANNNLLNNTTTSSKHNAVSSKATTSSWAKLFGSSSISSSTITPDTVACGGLCSTALASDAVWAAQLDAAVATEVQLLADMCVLALQHVHKIAAVSAMLDDKW